MERGKFIVIEGVGGSGKTTQIERAKKILERNGLDVVVTREPGGVEPSESIRELIFSLKEAGLIGPEGQMSLFFAARKLWLQKIVAPNINNGITVITDRSHTSTGAYQGYAEGGNMDNILGIANIVMKEYKPDAVILLDIDAEASISRRGQDTQGDPFDKEGREYLDRLIAGYRQMARENWGGLKWYTVDGKGNPEEVTKLLAPVLYEIFNIKPD